MTTDEPLMPTDEQRACTHEWNTMHIDGCHYSTWSRSCRSCGAHEESTIQRALSDTWARMWLDPEGCSECNRIVKEAGE